MPRNSLFISRALHHAEHAALRNYMDDFGQRLPGTPLRWRKLGEVGVTLIQSGEYEALTQRPKSRFHGQTTQGVARQLNDILEERGHMVVPVTKAAFLGRRRASYIHVGFSLEPETLRVERDYITDQLDKLNKDRGDWGRHPEPFLSVATLSPQTADDSVLEAFQAIMPANVTLYEPRAHLD